MKVILHCMTIVTLCFVSVPSVASQTLELRTGETRSLEIPASSRIVISTKGIISLTHERNDRWLISGMKSGLVKISAQLKNGPPKIIFVNVVPQKLRATSSREKLKQKALSNQDGCSDETDDTLYVVRVSVELIDNAKKEDLGFYHDARLSISGTTANLSLGLDAEPYKSSHHRQIIANPLVLSRACHEIILRTGGEDEITTASADGRASVSWKAHGLDLKMKIMPLSQNTLKVPFYVALRTPSKGQGSYGLTDVQSTINTSLASETLAAAINLSSSISFEKSPWWVSELPILGPLFHSRDNTKAESTLLVWFKINQRSVTNDTP